MPKLTDPMNALNALQTALDCGIVSPNPGEIHPYIFFVFDVPHEEPRFTYVRIINEKVVCISLFILADEYEGLPCFNVGYAVVESMRQQGLATDILNKGIDELKNFLCRNGIREFWLEAIVGIENVSSIKVAEKVLTGKKEKATDCYSGEAVFQFMKLIK